MDKQNKTKKEPISAVVRKSSIQIPAQELKTTEILDEINNLSNDNWDERFSELEYVLSNKHPFEYLYRRITDMELEIERLNRLLKHHHADGKILYEE